MRELLPSVSGSIRCKVSAASMGRGKSWDAHENAALAAAWVAAWREAGENAETGSRAFARAVHERFSKATPPSGAPPPPGRYAARSEQACKQHFADLAAEVRRAGSVPPPPNSPIAQAWTLLRAVPRFRTDVHKIETDEEGADEIGDNDENTGTASVLPSPITASASAIAIAAGAGSASLSQIQQQQQQQQPSPARPASSPQPISTTPRKPRKRARTLDDSTTAGVTAAAAAAAVSEQISGLDVALKSLAESLRGLVDTHGERNALMAFSERACTDQQAVKDRAEYLAILRRIYLHKARAKEQLICPRTTSSNPNPIVRTPSLAVPVIRRTSSGVHSAASAAPTPSPPPPPPVIASNGSSSDGGGGGANTGTTTDFPAATAAAPPPPPPTTM